MKNYLSGSTNSGLRLYTRSGACKKFCVNATEQISDRIFEYDHQTQS
jgi:hypothetical protein